MAKQGQDGAENKVLSLVADDQSWWIREDNSCKIGVDVATDVDNFVLNLKGWHNESESFGVHGSKPSLQYLSTYLLQPENCLLHHKERIFAVWSTTSFGPCSIVFPMALGGGRGNPVTM